MKVHKVVMVRNIVICWSLSSQVLLSLASLEVLVFVSAPDASGIGPPRILHWLWLSATMMSVRPILVAPVGIPSWLGGSFLALGQNRSKCELQIYAL